MAEVINPSRKRSSGKFNVNEEVLAFDGPWIYSARILKIQQGSRSGIENYKIHYEGWSAAYDEEVASERLLKINAETKAIKTKLDAQALLTLQNDLGPIEAILKNEGRHKMFEKGNRVIVYAGWLLHNGYVMDVKFAKRRWAYCIRFMLTKIHYEDWIKSGNYKDSRTICDEWMTSDRIFEDTNICLDIEKKLLKYRKMEDDEIIKDYFESQEKISPDPNENDVMEIHTMKEECIDIDIQDEPFQDSNDSYKAKGRTKTNTHLELEGSQSNTEVNDETFIISRNSDVRTPLRGRLPQESTFVRDLEYNSTLV